MIAHLEAASGLMSPVKRTYSAFMSLCSAIKHLRSRPQAASILAPAKTHIEHQLITYERLTLVVRNRMTGRPEGSDSLEDFLLPCITATVCP